MYFPINKPRKLICESLAQEGNIKSALIGFGIPGRNLLPSDYNTVQKTASAMHFKARINHYEPLQRHLRRLIITHLTRVIIIQGDLNASQRDPRISYVF